ncbi:MAG: LytTR family DNA-binding domain-containing protein [Hungatella sp.]
MHIAVCDDDYLELTRITALLDTYRQKRNIGLTYQAYQSAVDLLFDTKSNRYDLFLLDILMPGFTGIQAAHEVRSFDSDVKIIFLTASPEFALDSYAVRAWDYMLKPVSADKLFAALDLILTKKQESCDGIFVKTTDSITHILYAKLAFVEVMNKKLYFHLSDNSVREVHAPLTAYEKELTSRPEFIKVHRSYLVNLGQMSELTACGFVSSCGKTIPVSRLLYSEIRQTYMDYLFMNQRDTVPSSHKNVSLP